MPTIDGIYNEDLDKDYAKIWLETIETCEVL